MKKPKVPTAHAVEHIRYFTRACPMCGEITQRANPDYAKTLVALEANGFVHKDDHARPLLRPGEYECGTNCSHGVCRSWYVKWVPKGKAGK